MKPPRKRRLRSNEVEGFALFILAAVAGVWVAQRQLPAWQPAAGPQLRGVFHVHSDSSHDGRIPAAELLDDAGRIGLDFVMFTEHDRQPVHPSAPGGPLAVPGTELSTRYGHLIFFGTDYIPEGGPVRRSVALPDTLRARGAFTVPAHPGSPKRPWTGRVAGVGGLEIANTSTDARVKGGPQVVGIVGPLLAYPFNRRVALAQLYRRDEGVLRRWDRLPDPSVVGVCGTDTHGWIDPKMNFRTWQIVLDWPDAPVAPDSLTAEGIVERVAAGRFVCVAGLLADAAPRFSFQARTANRSVPMGSSVPARGVEELLVSGPIPVGVGPRDAFSIALLRDGLEVARTDELELAFPDPGPGTYRVEVDARTPRLFFGFRYVPVIYSNRIRLTE